MISPVEQPTPPESEIKPVDLDAWKKDYPKTREEADAQLKAARDAYYALEFPETDSLPDTPPEPLGELLPQYSKRYEDVYTHKGEDGGMTPAYENIRIPPGFEDWTVQKIQLAQQLWQARHREWAYTYRIAHERNEAEDFKAGRYQGAEAEKEKAEGYEIVTILGGNFEVIINNGKPEIKTTSYGDLGKELWERFNAHHNDWVKRHQGILSKFPRLSGILAVMSMAKKVGIRATSRNLESFITFTYLSFLNQK